jgi:hypothetical protein
MESPPVETHSHPAVPWSRWIERGVWAKLAVALGLVAVGTSIWSIFFGEGITSLTAAMKVREGAEAVGRLTPYIALLSILVEPTRFQGWAYASILIWAAASALLAIGNLHDTVNLYSAIR